MVCTLRLSSDSTVHECSVCCTDVGRCAHTCVFCIEISLLSLNILYVLTALHCVICDLHTYVCTYVQYVYVICMYVCICLSLCCLGKKCVCVH